MTSRNRKLRVAIAIFLWGMILCYGWVSPRVYESVVRRYADFSTFYTAGKIVQRGQARQMYNLSLQAQVQSEFSSAAALHNRALPYIRPPFEALLFLPLSYLPYPVAYGVWLCLSLALVGGTAAFLRSRIPEFPQIPWWIYYPAYFSFCPLAYGLAVGQDCALVFFLFALVITSLNAGKDFRAGCALGLALIKFQLVLPLVFVLVLKRKFRALAGFSTVAAFLFAVSAVLAGWEGLMAYPAYLWRLNQAPAAAGIYPSMMPSLRGLVEGWSDPMHGTPRLDWVTAVLSLALLLWAARQWSRATSSGSRDCLTGISLVVIATLMAGYHASGYDLMLLFPIVLRAAYSGWCDRGLDAATRLALLLGSVALLFAPLYIVLVGKAQLNLLALPVLLVAWGLSCAISARQSGGADPRTASLDLPQAACDG